ncbi:penicillin-binding protein activator [Halorhodospira halophila]|uniref:LppC family lipoprotein n=1 Tax=Halorhodospira halophila (strain DSM 244 / SL1) TaxID=349124 RepID=A1WYV4_HALHL|nr:penicillin-binding protein activator [Halorhodospira halophila]ABM62866.1 LppC family lipoprotein [Halorhodospira halophila SL1]MBK1728011.1 penicillin-binding protein activator [Halorhodospira halophila]
MTCPTRVLQFLIVAALLAALYSCAPTPVTPADTPEQSEAQADDARAAGDAARAAELYDAAAEGYEEAADRNRVSIAAARSWLEAEERDAATTALARVDPEHLGESDRDRFTLARAQLALQRERPDLAASLLDNLAEPPAGEEADYHRLRAAAAAVMDDHLKVAEQRVALEQHLETPSQREENRNLIWQALGRTPAPQLQEIDPDDDTYGGWVRLAQIARSHRLDPERLEEAVSDWEAAFPDHPARDHQATELITRFHERIRRPERVALLLPLSGDFREAGRAVRDGILSAYFSDNNQRPEITVHDTGGDPERALEALAEAREADSDAVIGPLTRGAVRAIADADESPPTLALNTLDDNGTAEHLYQFALTPETDARQAALHAQRRGWSSVVILAPRTDWGERVQRAFQEAFEETDGTVLQSEAYDAGDADFSGPIREVLNLRVSSLRHQELTRTLGQSLEYQPRRRQDVDAIFLAASPEAGRLLRPQLEYHHAQDVPVLSTAHIYGGAPRPEEDRDLDGLHFVDGPWLVGRSLGIPEALERERLAELLGDVLRREARLVALGIDAYRIFPYLEVLSEHPEERLDGLTGKLHLNSERVVERELVAARFVRGRPVFEQPATEGGDDGPTDDAE